MSNLSDRLKSLRLSANMTQEEFGKKFGIVKSTVSLYESGKSTPNDQIKKQICSYFNVTVDYLLGIDHPEDINNLTLQEDTNQLTPDEESLLQAYKRCSEECQRYLIAKAQVLSVEGISAVTEHGKYIDQEKKSHPLNGTEDTGILKK